MLIRGRFCESVEAPKSRFDRRSLRWKKSGRTWLLVGCPRRKWNPRQQRCNVGTRAVKILRPSKQRCPVGTKTIVK